MPLKKERKIEILLAIDLVFFLLEISIGYATHSLALVADAFHMLNDVLSLCVARWAIKLKERRVNSDKYTYGWQRAETLGALSNGIFLVALCLSIVLDAISRFFEPQEVSQPKLVCIVGCFGLASNIIGLALFHDHGHSHGGHSHGHSDSAHTAEEGHAHGIHAEDHAVADEHGIPSAKRNGHHAPSKSRSSDISRTQERTPRKSAAGKRINKRHHRSQSRNYATMDEIYVHPSSFRNSIIESSRLDQQGESASDTDNEAAAADEETTEQSPLLQKGGSAEGKLVAPKKRDCHSDHRHTRPNQQNTGGHGHGHSHGDLNMRGVFLHVMGDALGNIGVIATALFIWLTDFSWRFYTDPVVSLVITVIILCSAIPLCKAAGRILLQAVPEHISVDDIKYDITELDGIIQCHHIHVWQLSDSQLVASLHVQVDFDFKGEGSARYMALAQEIRQCLHAYGIHSSTIQPEFCLDESHDHTGHTDESSGDEAAVIGSGSRRSSGRNSKSGSVKGDPDACLLECSDVCGNSQQCCNPGVKGCQGGK